MRARKAPRVAATNNGATTNKTILTRKRLFNKARCAALRGSFAASIVALCLSCMTEDLRFALVLAIPSAIWAGVFFLVNYADAMFWEDLS